MRAPTPALGAEAPRRPAPVSAVAAPAADAGGPAIPFVEVSDYEPNARVVGMLPTKLVLQHRAIPLRLQGNRLLVGMVLPRNAAALNELRRVLHTVDFEVAAISLEDFAHAVLRYKVDTPRGPAWCCSRSRFARSARAAQSPWWLRASPKMSRVLR